MLNRIKFNYYVILFLVCYIGVDFVYYENSSSGVVV